MPLLSRLDRLWWGNRMPWPCPVNNPCQQSEVCPHRHSRLFESLPLPPEPSRARRSNPQSSLRRRLWFCISNRWGECRFLEAKWTLFLPLRRGYLPLHHTWHQEQGIRDVIVKESDPSSSQHVAAVLAWCYQKADKNLRRRWAGVVDSSWREGHCGHFHSLKPTFNKTPPPSLSQDYARQRESGVFYFDICDGDYDGGLGEELCVSPWARTWCRCEVFTTEQGLLVVM